MGDTSKNWLDGWLEAQQKYWKSWADLTGTGLKAPEAPKNPWADGIAQWWQAVAPMTPPAGREVFDKMMDMARGYFGMAERLAGGTTGKDKGVEVLNGWFEQMQKGWSDWFQGGLHPDPQFKDMMAFWDLPMDTWHRLAASLMPMPGDFTQAFHPEGVPVNLREQMNRFLSIPAVGYTREFQEQYQRLMQLSMDYGTALQAYQMAFGKLAMETTGDFQRSLQARAMEGEGYGSLREVYDGWVEMSEGAYARYVMTQEYQELYGRLVNSLMALKHQLARLVDQGLEAMHMPSRAEISTLQCRQQELRRENIRLRRELKAIQEQLEAMRLREIQPSEEKGGAVPAAKTASTAGTARKTAAAKKAPPRRTSTRAPAASKSAQKKTGGTRK